MSEWNVPLTLVERLEKLLNTKTVIGEPMELGGLTLIPVVDMIFGFGGGAGEGKGKESEGTGAGGGGGAGARIAPRAVLVIKDGEVSLLPLQKGGALEKILESVPGLVEKLEARKAAKASGKEATAEE